ncbi:MAG: outer membrane beta-barrel domain-containing protein [Polyangiaceae bacterium]|nr:outer membrane beta-barrel domain-containing protein [Polyangiaceae bacterium]MBK8941661.1 outer membrane beta-barrel domain-containing protein [Polyangiaceae bacterium]
MNQARVGLLVAAALVGLPLTAAAQPKTAGQKAEEPAPGAEPGAQPGAQPGAEGTEATEPPTEGGEEPATGGGLEELCAIDPDACKAVDLEKAAARELEPEMYAVQQIYALRRLRFELNLAAGLTLNDQFVSHPSFAPSANFYITNVIGVGLSANVYGNSPSNFNFQTSRAARIGQSITEYQWNANANFLYVPVYGKFAGFSDFIFHYDVYLIGGVGAISTRPIAVVDPDNRTFDWKPKVAFNVGGGLRIFFNRWFAVTAEIRDYIFPDELENQTIVSGVDEEGVPLAQDPSTWLAEEVSWTNNVQAQIGLSFFLPPTWEYRLPK